MSRSKSLPNATSSIPATQPSTHTMPCGEDTFAHTLMRKSVAQIIYAQAERQSTRPPRFMRASARLRPVHASTLHLTSSVADAFSDIAAAFIETLARSAAARSHLAARSSSTLLDVHAALLQLYPITNASPRDLAKYVLYEHVQFPHDVPQYPVLPEPKRNQELFAPVEGEGKKRPFVEPWMPCIPPQHTFVVTPVYVNPQPNPVRGKVDKTLAKLGSGEEQLAKAAPGNPFVKVPTVVGVEEGEVREVEPVQEQVESNVPEKTNANEQKRQKVERILAEGGLGGTAVGGGGSTVLGGG